MNKTFCDIRGCKERAFNKQVMFCSGYHTQTESSNGIEKYKPYERPIVVKYDLCEKHFKKWCKAICEAFYPQLKELQP